MKSVLISIQPYWVFLIIAKIMGWDIDKEKSVEVRKNFPKANDWNKLVEIYCSKDKKSFNLIPKEYQPLMQKFLGKVIGKFTCDWINEVYQCNSGWVKENACISRYEFFDYLGIPRGTHFGYDKKAYGWHISNLKIYDKPKELSEFTKYMDCKNTYDCCVCHNWDRLNLKCIAMNNEVKSPPQSWCYVESLGE